MLKRQLLHFLWVGGIGFFVDGGLLTLLSTYVGMNIYIARIISFVFATLATWWLNRTYAFSETAAREARKQANEYARYISVQLGGGLINFAAFSLCIAIEPDWRSIPLLPLAVGSAFGLVWNFVGAKLWAFRNDGTRLEQET